MTTMPKGLASSFHLAFRRIIAAVAIALSAGYAVLWPEAEAGAALAIIVSAALVLGPCLCAAASALLWRSFRRREAFTREAASVALYSVALFLLPELALSAYLTAWIANGLDHEVQLMLRQMALTALLSVTFTSLTSLLLASPRSTSRRITS